MEPVRIQRLRKKGFKLQDASPNGLPVVYIGRPTRFGNPFRLTPDGWILYFEPIKLIGGFWCNWSVCGGFTTEEIVSLYEKWITRKLPSYLPKVPDYSILRGKNLSCFCSLDKPCHADVLIRLANL